MDCSAKTVTKLHTLGLLWLFSAVSDSPSLKGRGEQWAEPLVRLATEQLDVAKNHTLHL